MGSPAYAAAPQSRGLAIASLVFGILSLLTVGCLGIGALAGIGLGIAALVKAGRQPQEYGGKGMAWTGIVTSAIGLVLLPIVGIVAAIAIPSFLRARVSANEAATIGDIRTVISAQAAYQSANTGFYDGRLACLARPAECVPGYAGPAFLDAAIASGQAKSGYGREFVAGTAVDPSSFGEGAAMSPSSVTGYAYVAWPVENGRTGTRAFCGDASGVICFTADGRRPLVNDAACDLSSCTVLQ
jgi:hypothetical protein